MEQSSIVFRYGMDCARKKKGEVMEESLLSRRPWLAAHVSPTPEAQSELPSTPRMRPLIYVYELPPEFSSRMLQYRGNGSVSELQDSQDRPVVG
jgi:hypothetical protein